MPFLLVYITCVRRHFVESKMIHAPNLHVCQFIVYTLLFLMSNDANKVMFCVLLDINCKTKHLMHVLLLRTRVREAI